MSFFWKLQVRVVNSNSLLCIGLDPHVGQLHEASAKAAEEFCIKIVNQTHHCAAAFKPNAAFFEQFGAEGAVALKNVIGSIPKDIPIILDCKRGDIGSTAQAYALASYDAYSADAVTLSPYMGWDSIEPFVTGKFSEKGAFVLCKTSNPSSNDFQTEIVCNSMRLFETVASTCEKWNETLLTGEAPSAVDKALHLGLVVGATDIDALRSIRSKDPSIWILCPGVGAQGGEANLVCPVALRDDGSGLLVSVSRGISKAEDMAKAAEALRDEINSCREQLIGKRSIDDTMKHSKGSVSALKDYQKSFLSFAINQKVLQFGRFTLKSGRVSPYFFNAGLFGNGSSMSQLGSCYARAIKESGISFDVLFGPAYKGIPLVTSVSIAWFQLFGEEMDLSYNRKEAKDHGEGGLLVGAPVKGRRVLIIDDVITAGTAIRESVNLLKQQEANIVAVAVCLDRQEKTTEESTTSAIQQVESEYGIPVLSIVKLKHLIQYVEQKVEKGGADQDVCIKDIVEYRSRYGVDY